MPKRLLGLVALAVLWASPAAAQPGGSSSDSRWHSSDCKSTHSQDRASAPAPKASDQQAPAARAPNGGFLSQGWLSFFSRPSSPLLP